MSLRQQFLLLLVALPSCVLALFLYFALSVFVGDKKLTVFETAFEKLNLASLWIQSARPTTQAAFLDLAGKVREQEGFEGLSVITTDGKVLLHPDPELQGKSALEAFGMTTLERMQGELLAEGSFIEPSPSGVSLMNSFMKLDLDRDSYYLLLQQPESGALRASMLFIYQSISAFFALAALAALLSLFFSKRLTAGLKELTTAIVAFGKNGTMNPLPNQHFGEVGVLSREFDKARRTINDLLETTKENAKLEAEIHLAGRLQKRFFPKKHLKDPDFEITGFIQAAHHAGGDWWYYQADQTGLRFVLADATGHGLDAAMMTAVSRAAWSQCARERLSPMESLKVFNQILFETSQGQLHMTCVLGFIERDTKKLTLANASHEQPFLLPRESLQSWREAQALNLQPGKRLGESVSAEYAQTEIELSSGQTLFLFSDGLTDLVDENNKPFGERRMLKVLCERHGRASTEICDHMEKTAWDHKGQATLKDDVSFLVIQV